MEKFKEWFENSWWNWVNSINYRFVQYNDNIDRCAFFEEINYGWYQMYIYPYDDWYYPTISKERKLLLNEDIPTVYVSKEAYDAIVYAINQPPDPKKVERLREIMNKPAPWDDEREI